MGDAQERWNIRIVLGIIKLSNRTMLYDALRTYHEIERAKAINFEGIDLAKLRVVDNGMFLNTLGDSVRDILHLLGERLINRLHDLASSLDVPREHDIPGDKILVDAGVIRGAEEATDETDVAPDRRAGTLIEHRLRGARRRAEPGVRRPDDAPVVCVRAPHQILRRAQDDFNGLDPAKLAEELGVLCDLVVVPGELEEGGHRVYLVLALEDDIVVHRGRDDVVVVLVLRGHAGLWGRLESIAVGVLRHVPGLQVDGPPVQAGDAVLAHDGLVGLELVGAVAHPHGIDVSSDDECQLLHHECEQQVFFLSLGPKEWPFGLISYLFIRVATGNPSPPYCGVKSAWPCVLKESLQVRVRDCGIFALDDLFHLVYRVGTAIFGGPLEGELVDSGGERLMALGGILHIVGAFLGRGCKCEDEERKQHGDRE